LHFANLKEQGSKGGSKLRECAKKFQNWTMSLKGMSTNFEYITFFSCLNKRNIFYKRSISIKQLWLKIIEKIGCSKSAWLSNAIYALYIIYNFEHNFTKLFRVRVVTSRWTLHKKGFFCWDTEKVLYIQLNIGEQPL